MSKNKSNNKNNNGNNGNKNTEALNLIKAELMDLLKSTQTELVLRPIENNRNPNGDNNTPTANQIPIMVDEHGRIATKQIWKEADQKCVKFKFHKIITGSFYEEGVKMLKELKAIQAEGENLGIVVGPIAQ